MNKRINFFKSLQILHLAILAGLSLFAIIALNITGEGMMAESESTNRNLQIIAIIFSLSSLFVGFNIFKKSLVRIRESGDTARGRAERYRISCITWWAMIEVPGLFAITGYLLTDNLSFFFLGLLHIVLLFVFMPRRENIILLLNLSSDEVSQLNDEG